MTTKPISDRERGEPKVANDQHSEERESGRFAGEPRRQSLSRTAWSSLQDRRHRAYAGCNRTAMSPPRSGGKQRSFRPDQPGI